MTELSPQLPRNLLGRNSVRLILEVVGAASLVGSRVLDVGCGRGGTVATLRAYCGPRAVVGVDLSPAAIAYCRRSNPDPGAAFLVGDAERLPFRDGAFDALINVESSHSYPDLDAFYSQVRRVLRPDGMFMYTDTVPADELADRRATAAALGFAVTVERDVTANVLRSCDEQAAIHAGAFEAANDRDGARGLPGAAGLLQLPEHGVGSAPIHGLAMEAGTVSEVERTRALAQGRAERQRAPSGAERTIKHSERGGANARTG